MMTRAERISSWKNLVRELPKQSDDDLLFEFYRVHEANPASKTPSGIDFCSPPHQRATKSNLAVVCAAAYGAGAFIALQIGENLEGFPLSFWVIRIVSADRYAAEQVFLAEEELNQLRQHEILSLNYGCKDEACFWQRGLEANLVAMKFLPEMFVPDQEMVKKLQERNATWKEFNGQIPKGTPEESLFVLLQANDGWMIESTPRESFTLEPCVPLFLRATPKTLAKVCARTHGGGSFVAVEVSESLDGLALSYWIIRVKSRDLFVSKQVVFDDERLKAQRHFHTFPLDKWIALDQGTPFDKASDRKYANFSQWFSEAALAARELKSLSIPEKKKRKGSRIPTGRPTDPKLDYVRKRRKEGVYPKELKPELVERGYAKNADEAEKLVKNAGRKDQIKRQNS